MQRRCEQCGGEMPIMARSHARTCSPRCRQRASRARRALPAELTSRRRWVRRDEHKVPLWSEAGGHASSTDPATWSDYATARDSRHGVGLGFVLAGDGLVCLDIDHCLTAGGELAEWARPIVESLPPTYIEVSPGGDGLHCWGRGRLDRGRVVRLPGGTVECYASGRYIAMTGQCWRSAPSTLADLSEAIASLT